MNVMKKKKEQKLVPQHKRSFWGNLCYYKEYYLMLIPGILSSCMASFIVMTLPATAPNKTTKFGTARITILIPPVWEA